MTGERVACELCGEGVVVARWRGLAVCADCLRDTEYEPDQYTSDPKEVAG